MVILGTKYEIRCKRNPNKSLSLKKFSKYKRLRFFNVKINIFRLIKRVRNRIKEIKDGNSQLMLSCKRISLKHKQINPTKYQLKKTKVVFLKQYKILKRAQPSIKRIKFSNQNQRITQLKTSYNCLRKSLILSLKLTKRIHPKNHSSKFWTVPLQIFWPKELMQTHLSVLLQTMAVMLNTWTL